MEKYVYFSVRHSLGDQYHPNCKTRDEVAREPSQIVVGSPLNYWEEGLEVSNDL